MGPSRPYQGRCHLGIEGWYSTNILGNVFAEVLDDPESFKSKEVSAQACSSTFTAMAL
jgi:myo-inositol-1-phosphate synthase